MDISAKLKQGVSHHQSGELAQAAKIYQQILTEHPTQFDALRLLGIIHAGKREFLQASKLLQKAAEVGPAIAVVHGNLGMVQLELGELDKSISSCRLALELDPNLVEAHCGLGVAQHRKGNLDAAIACFDKAIALDPRSVVANSNLGALFGMKGDFPRSIHYLRATCHLLPDQAQPLIALASGLRTVRFNQSNESLKQDLLNCFSVQGLRYTELAVATTSVLLLDSRLRPVIDKVLEGKEKLTSTFLSNAVVASLNDPLLLQLLQKCTVPDYQLEQFLTRIRELLLALAIASDESSPAWLEQLMDFSCSLAQLCFFNEYLYMENSDEAQSLEVLHQQVESLSGQLDDQGRLRIAVYACYRQLYKLDNAGEIAALGAGDGAPVFRQVIKDQVTNPLTELAIRSDIPSLVVNKDAVTELVQAQYEENPFPRWRSANTSTPGPFAQEITNALPQIKISTNLNCESPEVLIAGCGTGLQAINCSYVYRNARITAIDISLTSLAYAKRMTEELGIENIEFIHANILELGQLEKQFDMIECYGVLHHLSDPVKGLEALTSLLKDGGLMMLGLYSEIGRQGVVISRDLVAQKNYPSTLDGIRHCRQDLFASPEQQVQENITSSGAAFWATSEVRDTIFHENEYRYTLPQVAATIKQFELEFLGFTHQLSSEKYRYLTEFPDDPNGLNLENWHLYEQKYPRTFANMYHFWVRK